MLNIKKTFIGLCLILLASCAVNDQPEQASISPAISYMGKIVTTDGQVISATTLVDNLAQADYVIIGEKHDNTAHHQAELWLSQELAYKRAQGSVVLEMINPTQNESLRQVQAALLKGTYLRPSTIAERLNWDTAWDWQAYGPTIMLWMKAGVPLSSANLTKAEIRRIYSEKPPVGGTLSNDPKVLNALKDIIRNIHEGVDVSAMLSVQQHRDYAMAQALSQAKTPALLIAGNIHASKKIGVPLYMQDLGIKKPVVLLLMEDNTDFGQGHADYIWMLPAQTK